MQNRKHYVAGIIAFVIWGFFAIPLRALKQYPAGEILYFRILFSLLILTVVIAGFKRKELMVNWNHLKSLPSGKRKKVIWLTLTGAVLLTINWLTFIYVVNNINVKTASFAYMVCPVMTAVFGYFLLRERLSGLQWTAVFLCALSCGLMGLNSWIELAYSFFTALTYALYLISQRKNQGFDRIIILGVQVLFSFLMLSLMYGFLVKEVPTESKFYSIIFTIAALFTVIPLFLNLYALNKISAATIGILMYLNPVFNFSLAFVMFHESASMLQIIGYGIIVIALIVFNYEAFKKIQPVPSTQKI
jgi:chloramphenicol-sensitive protein RarD